MERAVKCGREVVHDRGFRDRLSLPRPSFAASQMSEEPEKTVTLQITVPPEWTPGDKLRARLPGGVKVVVNAPASTKVGDTLEFELPASILNEDADEPGEEEAEEAPPPAAAPAAAEPPPSSSQKRQSAAASSRLSAFGLGGRGGRKTRVVSVAGALRNDVVKDEKFTSTRI